MPWQADSPIGAAASAAGAFFQGRTARQQQDLQNRLAQEQLQHQAADAAARQQLAQQQEKFEESLYSPAQYKTITTTGTYQQGPQKGKPKTMTRQEMIPGTEGYYAAQQRIAASTAAALAQERMSMIPVNAATARERDALTYYWQTKPGIDEKRIYEQAQAHANTLKARLSSGRSSGMTEYQLLNLQRQVDQANAAAQERYQAMVQHAQDHADAMNISASIAGQQPNFQPQPVAMPQPITINVPGYGPIGAPPQTQSNQSTMQPPPGAKPGQQFRNKLDGKTYEVGKDGQMHPVTAGPSMGFGKF